MTKPVLRQPGEMMTRVAFVLPAEFSLKTVPKPDNPRIRIREIPARHMAVLRFGGYANDRKMEVKRERLVSFLTRDGLRFGGDFWEAYYNPPWTPPFMGRNEVMIEID